MFTDLAGDELCLRPDLTVPVSRLYLERHPKADQPARYCYNGPAFRFQPQGDNQAHPREFRQAGIECFGESRHGKRRCRDRAARGRGRAQRRAEGFPPALRRHRAVLCAARCAGAARALAAQAAALFLAAAGVPRAARAARQGRAPERRRPGRGACREPRRAHAPSAPRSWSAPISTSGGSAALRQSQLERDHRAAARSCRGSARRAAAARGRDRHRLLPRRLGPAQGGGRAHRHDRQGRGHRSRPCASRQYAAASSAWRKAASISASAIFATEFGRSLEYYSGLVFQIEVAGIDEAIGGGGRYDGLLVLSRRAEGRCRPSARPSTPSGCLPRVGRGA